MWPCCTSTCGVRLSGGGVGVLQMKPTTLSSLWFEAGRHHKFDRDSQVVGQDGLWPCQSSQGLPRFGLPLSSRLRSTPLCRLPHGPQFGLVLMLGVAPVPHPCPLTVTCCFFFSSTDAIHLSKLCLSSVLSGWIKVSCTITLVLEPNIPSPPRPCSFTA